MPRILITGAGGFVGSHILEAALRDGWHATAIDSFTDNGDTDRVVDACLAGTDDNGYQTPTFANVYSITHDMRAPFSTRQVGFLQAEQIDLFVHAAAHCSVDQSILDPRGHVLNNIAATVTALDLARDIQPARFLLISTDEVYGGRTVAAEESLAQHNPSSPYAASKAASEDITVAYGRTFGLPVTILNSQNLFGPRQSMLAFIPRMIRHVQEGIPITLHTDPQTGQTGFRWYTYVPNLAQWILDRDYTDGRYPLKGQLGISIRYLAERVAALLGKPLLFDEISADLIRPGWDPRYPALPDERTWQPQIDAAEGLEATVKWFTDHPGWLG